MPKPQYQVNWDILRSQAEQGVPLRELARRCGVPIGTVLARASRGRWRIRSLHGTGRRPETSAKARAITEKTLQTGHDYFTQLGLVTKFKQAQACHTAADHFANMNGEALEQNSLPWTNSVKNAERVFSWNQQPEDQKHLTVNLQLLSITPFQLFCYSELTKQGKLPHDASYEDIPSVIDSLPIDERDHLTQAFASFRSAPARDIPS